MHKHIQGREILEVYRIHFSRSDAGFALIKSLKYQNGGGGKTPSYLPKYVQGSPDKDVAHGVPQQHWPRDIVVRRVLRQGHFWAVQRPRRHPDTRDVAGHPSI